MPMDEEDEWPAAGMPCAAFVMSFALPTTTTSSIRWMTCSLPAMRDQLPVIMNDGNLSDRFFNAVKREL
ncbi:hypothetical protein E2562_023559 [Oryza meyeriana var. granulata]|uniref:Uncharacterized protein n=1 Tax=Oryza meyeriana var. granulata TaxID=110450 RepID=A0A6G1DZV8_9ORYZ|nr:hypothetical protein E2562_023559 [Oryza meyeriana var. granulata]